MEIEKPNLPGYMDTTNATLPLILSGRKSIFEDCPCLDLSSLQILSQEGKSNVFYNDIMEDLTQATREREYDLPDNMLSEHTMTPLRIKSVVYFLPNI